MNKILLIIQREYLTRVRKKTFIISTILFPLLYLALIFGMSYLGATTMAHLKVAVIDSSGYFNKGQFERSNATDSTLVMTLLNEHPDSLKNTYKRRGLMDLLSFLLPKIGKRAFPMFLSGPIKNLALPRWGKSRTGLIFYGPM